MMREGGKRRQIESERKRQKSPGEGQAVLCGGRIGFHLDIIMFNLYNPERRM